MTHSLQEKGILYSRTYMVQQRMLRERKKREEGERGHSCLYRSKIQTSNHRSGHTGSKWVD